MIICTDPKRRVFKIRILFIDKNSIRFFLLNGGNQFWKIFNNGGKYENSTLNKFSNLQGFVHPNAKIGASFLRSVPNFLKTSDLSKINRETYN